MVLSTPRERCAVTSRMVPVVMVLNSGESGVRPQLIALLMLRSTPVSPVGPVPVVVGMPVRSMLVLTFSRLRS